jgi:poly(3-hydroxybutyrate) depolymerase
MVKQVRFSATFLLLLLILCSCVSGQQHKEEVFSDAKTYPAIKCIADTTVSYALFLPPSYSKDKPSPLLILFDSHGDGLLPVNLFSAEAAKSGFIIAGSNNSKNGMPMEQTTAFYRTMLADLSSRLNLNKKAVYLCGFSGGSRVAGAAAITEGGVAGVVGCGAGLPNINQKPVSAFSYLAVVGNQDFNFTEMQQLDESLDQAGYQHHLLVFDGIHQWPPKETIPDIFTWLRFDAMRQQAIPDNRAEINSFIEKNDKMAVDFEKAAKPAQQQEIYSKMMHYLQGLTDVAPLQAEINRLGSEKEVIAFHEKQKQLLQTEQELQRKYAPEIQQKEVAWWTAEAKNLHSLSEKTENPEMSAVYKRVLGYLSLNSYMYSTGALKQGDLVAASKYIEIYRLVDPTNSEHRYLAAEVAALSHQPDDMFNDLKQAFDLGFKDLNRLKSDPVFKPYHQDERFVKLIEGR